MLILPQQNHFSLRALPFVTLLLILANVAAFVYWQGQDAARERDIVAAYEKTELVAIEVPRYRAWLDRQVHRPARERLRTVSAEPAKAAVLMLEDPAFLRDLRAGRVVPATDPQFVRWREERQRMDDLLSQLHRERFALSAGTAAEPWRYLTYGFVHDGWTALIGGLVVLLLIGPFAEASLGAARFLFAYLMGGAFAGAAFLMASPGSLVGLSGPLSAVAGMVLVAYGARQATGWYSIGTRSGQLNLPAAALLILWLLNEALQWVVADDRTQRVYVVQFVALASGALLAWLLSRPAAVAVEAAAERDTVPAAPRKQSAEAMQLEAEDAAARMDVLRATKIYRNLLQMQPQNVQYLTGYFRVALLGTDADTVADAAVRVLGYRGSEIGEELNRAYLNMSQPRVLEALPVEEQLRLARRLVRTRDDETALRILDRLLEDEQLRNLYGRQISDCLLGVFTAYARYGLTPQAEQVRGRLSKYFRTPADVASGASATPGYEPREIAVNTRPLDVRPDTVYMDYDR